MRAAAVGELHPGPCSRSAPRHDDRLPRSPHSGPRRATAWHRRGVSPAGERTKSPLNSTSGFSVAMASISASTRGLSAVAASRGRPTSESGSATSTGSSCAGGAGLRRLTRRGPAGACQAPWATTPAGRPADDRTGRPSARSRPPCPGHLSGWADGRGAPLARHAASARPTAVVMSTATMRDTPVLHRHADELLGHLHRDLVVADEQELRACGSSR